MLIRMKMLIKKLTILMAYITYCYLAACGSDTKDNNLGYNNISDSTTSNQVTVSSTHNLTQDKEIQFKKKETETPKITAADTYQIQQKNTQLKNESQNTELINNNNELAINNTIPNSTVKNKK